MKKIYRITAIIAAIIATFFLVNHWGFIGIMIGGCIISEAICYEPKTENEPNYPQNGRF